MVLLETLSLLFYYLYSATFKASFFTPFFNKNSLISSFSIPICFAFIINFTHSLSSNPVWTPVFPTLFPPKYESYSRQSSHHGMESAFSKCCCYNELMQHYHKKERFIHTLDPRLCVPIFQ